MHIELGCFSESIFYDAYFVDLAADVEMDEFEAVFHVAFFKDVECFEKLGGIEAEFTLVATAFAPFACACA